ncbi:hypothetical protein H6G00_00840 [Leptolyngbya sp. FACHB-541]|uniref:hypothetical protein n=1 Tax=Leptolyngbya sp. FACHB-541 TaxID=2692810 RepID=UPI001682DC5C|nr:hypothetical protein [Leptolyngbya sp. FACHB-541]MBD1995174.1 hypothetical protein [Leptolyngbya sp. FACHB-541]
MLEIFNEWAELEKYEHLQWCLQEAIAARPDWVLILELSRHSADGSPVWTAMLYRADDVEPFMSSDVEAALALLDAYTQALEAEQTSINEAIANE